MFVNFVRAGALSVTLLAGSSAAVASEISIEDKVSLQASMLTQIDRMTIDGVIPHVNLDDGSISLLVAAKAHPMILEFGDLYVLCTDFRNKDGNFVNIDFYVKKHGQEFVIFQTEVNNRASLEKLMKDGKVSMLK